MTVWIIMGVIAILIIAFSAWLETRERGAFENWSIVTYAVGIALFFFAVGGFLGNVTA